MRNGENKCHYMDTKEFSQSIATILIDIAFIYFRCFHFENTFTVMDKIEGINPV